MGNRIEADYHINQSEDGDFLSHPGYRARTQGRNRIAVWGTIPFRSIASATNERTLITAFIRRSGMSGKAPHLRVTNDGTAPLIVALFNSFVIDFAARSAVGGTDLSYFIIKQLPILHPVRFKDKLGWGCTYEDFIVPRVLELTYTSSELKIFAEHLGCKDQPFPWNEDHRVQLKCEIDAALFRLYGMDRDEVDHVMETFTIIKRDDERNFGEFRTKRMILETYDAMVVADLTETPYETRLAPWQEGAL